MAISTYLQNRDAYLNQIMASDLYGRNIYILGSAEFGPVNEPVMCRSTAGVARVFGSNGTLYDAFHKIKHTNKNNNVYLVKVTGEPSMNFLNVNTENGVEHEGMIFQSEEANEIFNEIKITVDLNKLEIELPKEIGGNVYTYMYDDYPYIWQLTEAINKDDNRIRAFFVTDELIDTHHAFYACNPNYIYLTGGMCGLNYTKDMLYNYLERTYNNLESMNIDLIIPVDAFLDDVYPDDMTSEETDYGMKYFQSEKDYLSKDATGKQLSYMNQLINFCIAQLNHGMVTHGVIGFNSMAKEYSDIYNESNDLAKRWIACMKYNYDICENREYSFLISAVAGDVKYNKKDIDNGYLAYASMCSDTMVTEGTTNLKISDNILLYHELEQEYLEELTDNGIVTFRQSVVFEQPVVFGGVTCYQKGNGMLSDEFANFANVRQIQLSINRLNTIFQYYIGCGMSEVMTVITEDVNKILKYLKNNNVLTEYSFSILPEYESNLIHIDLVLEALYMVKPLTISPTLHVAYDGSGVIE